MTDTLPAPLKNWTTLVVDDDEALSEEMREMLKALGLKSIKIVNEGEAAKAHLETVDFDLLILDILMPDTDGIDILRNIKKTRQVPTTLLISRDKKLLSSSLMLADAYGVPRISALEKPITLPRLRDALSALYHQGLQLG